VDGTLIAAAVISWPVAGTTHAAPRLSRLLTALRLGRCAPAVAKADREEREYRDVGRVVVRVPARQDVAFSRGENGSSWLAFAAV
jgi:hypothetical protein